MTKIRAIIVDDEKNGRENLSGVLKEYCQGVEVCGEAASAIEAIKIIEELKPELVFLDIEMPGGNGFQVLECFKTPEFKVIFVTAYNHYAIQAIRFSALDYILKPIDALLLKAAVQRFAAIKQEQDKRLENFLLNATTPQNEKKIALPFTDKIDFIKVTDIVKCKGEASYTKVYLTNGKEILTSKPLIDYEEILQEYGFIRSHKAYIVNIAHVDSFIKSDGGFLKMSDKSEVPVSRRKKEEVLNSLKSKI